MGRCWAWFMVLVYCTLGAGGVSAQSSVTDAQTPDTTTAATDESAADVVLRVAAGPSLLHAWQRVGADSIRMGGLGWALHTAVGAYVVDELQWHMDLSLLHSGGAGYSVNGDRLYQDVDFTLVSFGIGASYLLRAPDVTLSVGAALVRMSVSTGSFRVDELSIPDVQDTGLGLGLRGGVGKYWALGQGWRLGLMVQFWYAKAPHPLNDLPSHLRTVAAAAQVVIGCH